MYKYDSEKGFSAGLMMWLLCIVILFCLGIQPIISVLFGAAAGAATWLIVAYWHFEPIPPEEGKKSVDEPTSSIFSRLRLPSALSSGKGKIPNPLARKPRKRI
jgi:xanthine/uracil permease